TPTCIVCRNWESNFSLLGPRTRSEKCLLQVHFRSVNYCQFNFVEHRTLIYVQASFLSYIACPFFKLQA
ncbi:hypothetical protein DV915_12445, partial [Staphylococcus aureus]